MSGLCIDPLSCCFDDELEYVVRASIRCPAACLLASHASYPDLEMLSGTGSVSALPTHAL